MSSMFTINVRNNEPQTQGFFFFQEPAAFTGGAPVYSNALYSQTLANYSQTGSILTFQVSNQNYAGIQEAHTPPQIGQTSGYASASRPIDLATGSGTSNDSTTASVAPLGLSNPAPASGVQNGGFRISTPLYVSPPYYNIGTAANVNGGLLLSSFTLSNPNQDTDVVPVNKFYVSTGRYVPGAVINFTQSAVVAAMCDFTTGYTTIDVTLEQNGTWTVRNVS